MSDRVTLRDVAREAGVHTSTASRALNAQTRSVVNPQTVDRVLRVARRLGYSPNPLARGLRTNRTLTVGIVIPDIENPLFGPIIAGAESALGDEGYSLLIADANRADPTSEAAVVNALIERRVDGLIMATALRNDATAQSLAQRGIPTVLVNRTANDVALPSIVGDDHAGIGLAVEHLVGLGHRSIGHVAGPRHISTGMSRYQAFLSWMQSLDLEVGPDGVEEAEWFQVEPGYEAAGALFDRRPDLTAIVAANDLIALGAYRAVRERGKEVGVDISITGYNDMPLLDLMQPPLTSVKVPYRQMGSEAAAMLLRVLSDESGRADRAVSVRLVPTLSVRDSTLPPTA
ncbi:MAG TPA: LacI family DNA-binding transcriptional regulator [Acidimicrobiia bacterium]